MIKNPPVNAGDKRDVGSIPGSGRSPGRGHGNPFLYSCLEKPMDRGAWWAIAHKITRSWTQLKLLSTHHTHAHVKAHFPPHAGEEERYGDDEIKNL